MGYAAAPRVAFIVYGIQTFFTAIIIIIVIITSSLLCGSSNVAVCISIPFSPTKGLPS